MRKQFFLVLSLTLVLFVSGICIAGSVTHTGFGDNADIYIESMHGNVHDILSTQADFVNLTQTFGESGSTYYGPSTSLDRIVYIENGTADATSTISYAGYDGDFGVLNVQVDSLSFAENDHAYFTQANGYNKNGNSGSSFMQGVGDYGLSQYAKRYDSSGTFEGGASVDLEGNGSGQINTNTWGIGGIPGVHPSGFGDYAYQEVADTHYGDDNMYVNASGSGEFEAQTTEVTPIWSTPSLSHAISANFDNSADFVDIEKSTGQVTSTYTFEIGLDLELSLMFK